MNLDKLSVNGDPYSDGVFDFLPGYTINPINGRIYLLAVGNSDAANLERKLLPNGSLDDK